MGESKEREGFFGKYTEHFDDAGNKIGESRERDGFFGKYTENTDTQGNKTGESRERDGFFGSYTEHTDPSGNKTGESVDREGFFGTYTEHVDDRGKKTGESKEREGFFGRYTEHTGSGWLGKSKGSNSQGVSTSSSGNSSSSGDYYSNSSARTSSFGIGKFFLIIICVGLGTVLFVTILSKKTNVNNSRPKQQHQSSPLPVAKSHDIRGGKERINSQTTSGEAQRLADHRETEYTQHRNADSKPINKQPIFFDGYDEQQLQNVFEFRKSGTENSWVNIKSGIRYSVIPKPAYRGKYSNLIVPCRQAELSLTTKNGTAKEKILNACRQNGKWIFK